MLTTDDEKYKWMLPMNESRSSEKSAEKREMILVASMPVQISPAAFIRVIERLKPKKRERERTTSVNDYYEQ